MVSMKIIQSLAIQQGKKKPEDWAVFVDQILALQGQKIVKEGKPLETTEQQVAELTSQATEFANKQLPIMKALQVIWLAQFGMHGASLLRGFFVGVGMLLNQACKAI